MYILKNEISILRIEEDEKLQIHKLFPTIEHTSDETFNTVKTVIQ